MDPLARPLRWCAPVLAVALLGAGCSKSASPAASPTPTSTPTAVSGATTKQHYLDTVNGLCDKLLADVIKATQGGSVHIPVAQYLQDWPAHHALLVAFDKAVAAVPVPASATSAAAAMRAYTRYADRLDAARLTAAHAGESAWTREVAGETSAATDPSIAALTTAGFGSSCEAR